MADDAQTIRSLNWHALFPSLNLFRAFEVAIHPSKLVLGFLLLFFVYAGGRTLDKIWPARSYAVADEIDQYTRHAWSHERLVPFADVAELERQSNADAYAKDLIAAGIVKDHAEALEAARRGEYRSELQAVIVDRRNKAIAAAADARDAAVKKVAAAATQPAAPAPAPHAAAIDPANPFAMALHQVEAAAAEAPSLSPEQQYDMAVRHAEATCQADIERLAAISPRPLFDIFFEYEVRQFHNLIHNAVSLNWLNGVLGGTGHEPPSIVGREESAAALPGAGIPPAIDANGIITYHASSVSMASDASVGVVRSLTNLAIIGPGWLLRFHAIYFILFMAWALVIWALFGGAICRIAAVHVARDEKISFEQALRFSASKLTSFFSAPISVLLIILVLGAALGVGGMLMYLPVIGPIVVGAFFILALVAGLIITLAATGTVAGFGLLYPTIAVEGHDSFDAISRSFSYVYARRWKMIFYSVVSLVYGALCFIVLRWFVFVMLACTQFFTGWFLWGKPHQYWPQIWPPVSYHDMAYRINFQGLAWSEAVAAFLIALWVYVVLTFLGAFVISFYFSANTIIYYLMRAASDDTDMNEVFIEEGDEEFGDFSPAGTTPAAVPAAAPATGGSSAAPPPTA